MASKTKPPSRRRSCSSDTARRRRPASRCPVAPGLHLADDGIRQAERRRPSGSPSSTRVDALYCSPLERTRETAAPIGSALGLRPRSSAGLLECDFGDWTGAKLKDLFKLPEWRTVQKAPSTFRFPNGESFTEMQVRIVGALDRLRVRHPGGTIVCVSHADPIKAAVAHAMGTHLDLFQRIVISPCSISAFAWSTGGPSRSPSTRSAGRSASSRRHEGRHATVMRRRGRVMSAFFEFEQVDTFTTGAIGRPGDRTFYLQARQGGSGSR
jgi:broad specificity phosphatase PhoE